MTKREEFEAALERCVNGLPTLPTTENVARVLALYDEAVEHVAVRLARVTKIANERTDAIVDLMHKNDKLAQPWADEAELAEALREAWSRNVDGQSPETIWRMMARVALSRPVKP